MMEFNKECVFVFENKDAAELVVKAYNIEDIDYIWTLLEQRVNGKPFYKPCRVKDYSYRVKADGWVISE
jgi:hypothetical protein